ncbi:MAG TPA: ExeM/NucH family extracellular endonuclease, partial [Acidimicrobiia bacterium]
VPGQVYDCSEEGWLIGDFTPGLDDTPGEVNICDAPSVEPTPHLISEIQGEGQASPHQDELVSIEGVVVGDFQEGDGDHTDLGGFFVQEETDDQDANPNTSEGVFVFAPGAIDVSEGDVVEVIGTVDEFFGRTQVADVVEVEILGSGSVPATQVTLPVTATSDLEKYEGMLVTFPQALVISEFFNFDRFGEIVLTTDRQYQGTHVAEPGGDANAVTAANRLSRITLDDGRDSQNPDPAIHPNGQEFTLTNTFRGGDTLENVTGAMDWSFGLYRIQPTQGADYLNANPRPTSPDPIPGDVRVASFNVLNFFTHLDDGVNDICGPTATMECRGADTAEELDRQLAKLVSGILALDADIVGVQEIENDIRDDEPVFPNRAHDAVLTLVEALNEVEGSTAWAWVGEASHYNDYPVRNDIIYRKSAVSPIGDPVALADMAFDRTRPETPDEPLGRPPLAQTFRTHGPGAQSAFTVVVNHFKSKGSDCASIGDPDLGDGQGFCNLTRVAQSEALLDFVDELSEDSPGGVLVIGDLNSYRNEDPIDTLEGGGLTDLVESFVGEDAYSYVFDGQLGYLDTALANDTMSDNVQGVTIFHINADEPDILDYDMSFKQDAQDALFEPLPYRVSDHDPVIVGLTIPRPGRGPDS